MMESGGWRLVNLYNLMVIDGYLFSVTFGCWSLMMIDGGNNWKQKGIERIYQL